METSWRIKGRKKKNKPHPKLVQCHPLGTCVRSIKQPCPVWANIHSLQQPALRPKYMHFLCQFFSHYMAVFALSAMISRVKFKVNTPSPSLLPLQHLSFSCKFNTQCSHAWYIASSSAMVYLFPESKRGHPGKTDAIPEGVAGLGFIREQTMNLQFLSVRYEVPKRIWDSKELAFVDP